MKFVKMVGAGNDFIILEGKAKDYHSIAVSLCQRKTGVGADGILVIEKSRKADFKMRVFNADGSEAEMCGNGLRCAAYYYIGRRRSVRVETMAGIYEAQVTGKNKVKIKMELPKDLTENIPLEINGRRIRVNYIDTGVPHTVIFVQGIEDIDSDSIGRGIRYHKRFMPRGTNVDFVEVVDGKNIKIRIYERGVEEETFACGTGAVASALITHYALSVTHNQINVHTKGGTLKVSFKKENGCIKEVYLEGEARQVYSGTISWRDYV